MRSTLVQISKRRQKAGATANYFETVVDEELKSIDEKLSDLRKIYMTNSGSISPPINSDCK
jgi:hypothetical protein